MLAVTTCIACSNSSPFRLNPLCYQEPGFKVLVERGCVVVERRRTPNREGLDLIPTGSIVLCP